MNAVIDIGNSRSKLALFSETNDVLDIYHLSTNEIISFLKEHYVDKILVSDVANEKDQLKNIKLIVNELSVLTAATPMPITTEYKTPETLGVDRLAACVGARKFTKGGVLVIDAGSCITYDFLTANNIHKGGIISPGLSMRLKAMHTFTSNLPLVSLKLTPLEGKSTEQCLQSGASNGTLVEMKGIIEGYRRKYEDLSIIIGGGDADFFDKNLKLNTFVDSNLVLEGLRTIFMYNE